MKYLRVLLPCLSRLLLLIPLLACAEQAEPRFKVSTLKSGLGVVWGLSLIAPDQLLFTERQGRVGVLSLSDSRVRWIDGAPTVWANGQGGLLDVAVPPDYKPNDWIYFTYSKPQPKGAATTLARARLAGTALEEWQDLLITRSDSNKGQHFGSRIAFDENGHIYFGVGDRGHRPNGQDLTNHAGTIIRLKRDGSVPADNPFVGRRDALPEIWSYGHRNPQGLCYDATRQTLWSSEHGPRGGDEINRILPGRNYGWPVVSHGKEYWGPVAVGEATAKAGMESPRHVYIPSIAPGSLLCYHGEAFPLWQGDLLLGALKLTHLNRVSLNSEGDIKDESRLLGDLGERLRSLAEGPGGTLLVGTDSGRILQLKPLKE